MNNINVSSVSQENQPLLSILSVFGNRKVELSQHIQKLIPVAKNISIDLEQTKVNFKIASERNEEAQRLLNEFYKVFKNGCLSLEDDGRIPPAYVGALESALKSQSKDIEPLWQVLRDKILSDVIDGFSDCLPEELTKENFNDWMNELKQIFPQLSEESLQLRFIQALLSKGYFSKLSELVKLYNKEDYKTIQSEVFELQHSKKVQFYTMAERINELRGVDSNSRSNDQYIRTALNNGLIHQAHQAGNMELFKELLAELNSYVTQWDCGEPIAGPFIELYKECEERLFEAQVIAQRKKRAESYGKMMTIFETVLAKVPSPFSSVPKPVCQFIFSYLDLQDAGKCREVCQSFKTCIDSKLPWSMPNIFGVNKAALGMKLLNLVSCLENSPENTDVFLRELYTAFREFCSSTPRAKRENMKGYFDAFKSILTKQFPASEANNEKILNTINVLKRLVLEELLLEHKILTERINDLRGRGYLDSTPDSFGLICSSNKGLIHQAYCELQVAQSRFDKATSAFRQVWNPEIEIFSLICSSEGFVKDIIMPEVPVHEIQKLAAKVLEAHHNFKKLSAELNHLITAWQEESPAAGPFIDLIEDIKEMRSLI